MRFLRHSCPLHCRNGEDPHDWRPASRFKVLDSRDANLCPCHHLLQLRNLRVNPLAPLQTGHFAGVLGGPSQRPNLHVQVRGVRPDQLR